MHSLYVTWKSLLDIHQQLLSDLESALKLEKKSLLTHDIDALKESTLLKDKATRKISQIKDEIAKQRKVTAQELGLDENVSLSVLFDTLLPDLSRELNQRRSQLLQQSNKIKKINDFNNNCLQTYVTHLGGIRQILSELNSDHCPTYAACGQTYEKKSGGRLINRSF